MSKWVKIALLVGAIVVMRGVGKKYGFDQNEATNWLKSMSERLGIWAIPAYVGLHTLTLALCLPYAVFFEAGASMMFGFFPAVLCVFCAKILGASLSFFIGRLVFRSSSSASEWIEKNKYFRVLSRGVEKDGWKFVLLARFSPMPSYMINYALAATRVNFVVDFLLPTVVGCMPMILQNTSLGSLAGAAVASASGSGKSQCGYSLDVPTFSLSWMNLHHCWTSNHEDSAALIILCITTNKIDRWYHIYHEGKSHNSDCSKVLRCHIRAEKKRCDIVTNPAYTNSVVLLAHEFELKL